MTEQIPTATADDDRTFYSRSPENPFYAAPMTKEKVESVMERLARQDREHRALVTEMDRAWHSPECEKIRHVVREDGNVDWSQFVKHCGGILEVVAMVDDYGLPDTDRIIPKVDELFNQHSEKTYQGGVVFRQHPRNRPYVAGRGTSAGEARAAEQRSMLPRDPGEGDAERLLRAEQEAASRPRTTHPR
jgi:hypothetical protein